MSHGTSDTIVISSIKTEAHNLNSTIASVAPRDGSSPVNLHANTTENRQLLIYGMYNKKRNQASNSFVKSSLRVHI